MRYLLILLTLSITYKGYTQYILDEFSTTISAHDLKVDSSGNYYLAGLNYYSNSQYGIVAKYDSTGALLWESMWGDDFHLVGDIVFNNNRLFGAVSGWEGDEWVFELDTETGDVVWQSPIETHREQDGAAGGIDAQLWLDHGHVMVNSWFSSSGGIDVRRIYCFEQDSGILQWYEDFTSHYGLPSDITTGRADEYRLPMGHAEDSLILYSYTKNHITYKTDISEYPLDSNGVLVKWDRYDPRIKKIQSDSSLIFNQPFLVDTSVINEVGLYSSTQFRNKIMFSASVGLNDTNSYGWYLAVYDLNFGTQLWDTLFVWRDGYEFRDLGYANGFLYCYGYTMNSNYVFTPKVFRLNVDFLDIVNEVEELPQEDLGIQLYPNPTNETLHINFEQAQEATIHAYNLTGALVLQRQVNTQNAQLDVSAFSEGIYLFQISTPTQVTTHRVVISK